MEKILSQDEIDALLKGVVSGEVETQAEADGQAPGGVKQYDLLNQERIIRGRMPTLELINTTPVFVLGGPVEHEGGVQHYRDANHEIRRVPEDCPNSLFAERVSNGPASGKRSLRHERVPGLPYRGLLFRGEGANTCEA